MQLQFAAQQGLFCASSENCHFDHEEPATSFADFHLVSLIARLRFCQSAFGSSFLL